MHIKLKCVNDEREIELLYDVDVLLIQLIQNTLCSRLWFVWGFQKTWQEYINTINFFEWH